MSPGVEPRGRGAEGHMTMDRKERELGTELAPVFGPDGLLPCITQDAESGEVLMFAWMNEEALQLTLRTGKATYYSRSRQKLWVKGESSGRFQSVLEVRVDCDQDVLLLRVKVTEPGVCHQGYRSCFYRRVMAGTTRTLEYAIPERAFDPETVYRPKLKD